MKNLYQQLSEAHQEVLTAKAVEFPTTMERIMLDLKSKNYSINLEILTASEIYSFLYPIKTFNLLD